MLIKYTPRSDDPWDKEKEDNPIDNKKEKERPLWSNKIILSNFSEPAVMIAFITATFYIFISSYYISYFQRLSISFHALDLPFTFYLKAGNSILYVLYYLILLAILIGSFKTAIKLYKNGTRDKEFIFVSISFLCFFAFVLYTVLNLVGNISLIISILFILIFMYVFPYEDYKRMDYKNLNFMNLFLIALLISVFIPAPLGINDAEKLIGGDAGSVEVKLILNNNIPDLLNKELVLAIHSDSRYYLVEKNESLPKEVNLYIIPDNQIKMIIAKPVIKEQRKFHEFYKDWRFR